ncbi:MAG TPA: CocE/NonD family hydrolase [Burkholderiaceae bacterium]|nr:CocE/NonD family hydrolase [Burkholderiaceae bacterium]
MKIVKSFPRKVKEILNTFIQLPDGTKLAARIWMPVDADKKPVPVILEYLPYRKRDGTIVRDALTHPYIAGHGYACVRVDMRGNGDSDGIMLDEYAEQELADAEDVIAWLVKQPWSTGCVGMMGISWGGFNGLQVAARKPTGLKAIITLCSTDDRYSDDIHYKGGCLLGENLGWSATMFGYSSRPPDPALVGNRWRAMWLERLESEPLLAIPWLEHPHRDAYWKHGSVCEDIGAIDAAVLAVGGWNDAYTNAVPRLVASVQSPVKGIIGPWAHKYPHFAVPEPRIGFLQEALRWWDQWLKGTDTGVARDPAHRTYIMDVGRPGASVTHIPGRWVSDDVWPAEKHEIQRLHLNADGLSQTKGRTGKEVVSSPQHTGADSGEYCIIWLGPEFPGDQRRDDSGSLTFDTVPLPQDMDLVGGAVLHLKVSSDKPVAIAAVRLNSVWPDGAVSRLTYAVANLCHRDSHEKPQALEPGKNYTIQIKLDDVACKVPKGHKLRVSISTSYWPLIWPAPEPVTLTVHTGTSFIDVPVRKQRRGEKPPVFAPAESAAPVELITVDKPWHKREVTIDQRTGETRMAIVDDFGRTTIAEHGLTTWSCGRENYSILPHDPLTAKQECHWSMETSRGDWKVRTETYSSMTATKTHWHVKGRLEAYEGEKLILTRDWDKKVKRRLV